MQDGRKAVWSIPYVSVAFFPRLKQNFIAYRSSSGPDCIFEIHQLWQSGCSCSFEAEIIKIGLSSHKMYSNTILNSQESRTILNACTKKYGNILNTPRIYIKCSWFNGYRRTEWIRCPEFKFWTRLFIFNMAPICIQQFPLKLWVNSRTYWALSIWHNNLSRKKTLHSTSYHHHVSPSARIFLTLFRHPSQPSIASGWSSRQNPVWHRAAVCRF